jgi:hypothetical protein
MIVNPHTKGNNPQNRVKFEAPSVFHCRIYKEPLWILQKGKLTERPSCCIQDNVDENRTVDEGDHKKNRLKLFWILCGNVQGIGMDVIVERAFVQCLLTFPEHFHTICPLR